jgi:uncharacterized protein (PEP-CTERM system associated)
MITKRSVLFAAGLTFLGATFGAPAPVRADDKDVFNLQDATDGKGASLDEGRFDRQRFIFTFDTRIGYDDNTLDEADEVTLDVVKNGLVVFNPKTGLPETITRSNNTPASVFVNFDAGFSYTAVNPRASLGIAADAGINYYFDRPGRNYDINGALTLNGTYKLTPRATLQVSSYNAYESNPDYGASNLTGFTGQVGGGNTFPGTSDQLNGDYFYTTNHIALNYQFTPRISLVSSGDAVAFAYADDYYATIEDRIELYADEQFVYLLQPALSAVAEYRFGYVDYFSINSDSISNFVLAGVDYSVNPRLRGEVRGGVEFRDYVDGSEFDTSPYFEGTLSYDISQRTALSLNLRYDIEEGDLSSSISNARTLRIGLSVNQVVTQRLTAYLSFYFTNADYHDQGGVAVAPGAGNPNDFDEDTFDVAVGLRYSFNRRISAEAGYTYTDVISGLQEREYDDNRYFAGVRFEF